MPRICTVCTHPERVAIERALVGSEQSFRNIAKQFQIGVAAVYRHKIDHLPSVLVEARKAEEKSDAINVLGELRGAAERLTLLFNACDAWLRDAEDPTRYDIGPRAEDVSVTYFKAAADGRKVRKRAKLSDLLARVERRHEIVWSETKYADPRELMLKVYDRIESQLELIAKIVGQLDERPQINILMSPEWVEVRRRLIGSLEGFPDARGAVADALMVLEANGYRN